jgi:CRP-like cAMP-binding protein
MFTDDQNRLIKFLNNLAGIPNAELAQVIPRFHPRHLKKNDHFVEAGQTVTELGFVISGLMRLYYLTETGDDFTKSFCAENEFIGAYSALLLAEPSRLYIQALEDTLLLTIPYQAYQTLTNGKLCWEIINRKLAENLFIKKERRESALLLEDAPTRYLNFLKEYPGLEERVKQHHVASYLGITPVSLSRIRANLKNLNLG